METTFAAENIEHLPAAEALNAVLGAHPGHTACLTCSFQAEDMIVLNLVRQRIPDIPVLFLDTGYHFAETYQYRDKMAAEWRLNVRNLAAKKPVAEQEAEFG